MTLQNQIEVRCTDLLDRYRYDLFVRGELEVTLEEEDLFKYAVVELRNGSTDLLLFETHSEVMNRYKELMEDPNIYTLDVIKN